MLNVEDTRFGRIEGLFQCKLPSSNIREVMLVQGFRTSTWKPPTFWPNIMVVKPSATAMFVSPAYVVRGALLVDSDLEGLAGKNYVVDDVVDADMYLRMMN
jgi:hypothetical protein